MKKDLKERELMLSSPDQSIYVSGHKFAISWDKDSFVLKDSSLSIIPIQWILAESGEEKWGHWALSVKYFSLVSQKVKRRIQR